MVQFFTVMNVMFAGMIGGWEMVLILAVVLVLFGAKKLPELAKGLGTGIKEFKKATREVTEEVSSAMDETPAPAPSRRLPAATVETQPQPEQQPSVPQSSPNTKA
jgi:sec-independent protein translocase protein TatA